jgi:hypothetical protein
MPSTPLSPDRKAITQLHTRVDVEAIDIEKGRTDRAAAVPRLVQLVPAHRDDLVDGCCTGGTEFVLLCP